jgi:hypothetical protein
MSTSLLIVVLLFLGSAIYQIFAVTKYVGLYTGSSPLKPTFDAAESNQPFSVRDWNGIVNAVSAFVGVLMVFVTLSGNPAQLFVIGGLVILAIFQIVGSVYAAIILNQIPNDVSMHSKNKHINDAVNTVNSILDTTRAGYYYPYVGSVLGAVVSLVSSILLGVEYYSTSRMFGGRRR